MSYTSDEELQFKEVIKRMNEVINDYSQHVDERLRKNEYTSQYLQRLVSLRKDLYDIQLKLMEI